MSPSANQSSRTGFMNETRTSFQNSHFKRDGLSKQVSQSRQESRNQQLGDPSQIPDNSMDLKSLTY